MARRAGHKAVFIQVPNALHRDLKRIKYKTRRSLQEMGEYALTKLVKSWKKRQEEKAHEEAERKKEGKAASA